MNDNSTILKIKREKKTSSEIAAPLNDTKNIELVRLDTVIAESNIVLEENPEGPVRISLFEGLYAVVSPIRVSVVEGVHTYELPFNSSNEHLSKTVTQITVDENLSEVTVNTVSPNGELVFDSSLVKVVKKDISNAVRLVIMSHMEKLLNYGTNIYNKNLYELTKKHDSKVKSYFKKNRDAGEVLHFKKLAEAIYQKSKGVSNSQLTTIADSYAHYKASREIEVTVSTAMRKGRALHSLLFTPKLFDSQFVVNSCTASGASNEGKFINLFFELTSIGKEELSLKEHAEVINGRNSFMKHPIAPLLLKEAFFEESFYTMIENFLFRGRIDCYILEPSRKLRDVLSKYLTVNDGEAIVLDLKFTFDNNDNDDQYATSVIRSGYHRQGSAYCSLIERKFNKKCVFILMTVESSVPYDVSLFHLDEAFMEIGELDVSRLLLKYKEHLDNPKLYQGRNAGVKTISPPYWYIQKFGNKNNIG
jgi:predicted Fe-Mo cluster-binding NifX family protein